MTTPAPKPKPKRSRRMIVWLVAVPVVILLLALAGANWKTFHLAYAKHLMGSTDRQKQRRGIDMVLVTHIHEGMHLEEVRRALAPTMVLEPHSLVSATTGPALPPSLRGFRAYAVSDPPKFAALLGFDANDRLRVIVLPHQWPFPSIPKPRKQPDATPDQHYIPLRFSP